MGFIHHFNSLLPSLPVPGSLSELFPTVSLPSITSPFSSIDACDVHGTTHLARSIDNPQYKVVAQKGFKSAISWWTPLTDSPEYAPDADVDIQGFEYPDRSTAVMDYYRHKTSERYFSHNINADGAQQGLERIALVHSVSGYLMIEGLLDDNKALNFIENHAALAIANPHLGDMYHDSMVYYAYSKLFPNSPIRSTPLERAFKGAIDEISRIEFPTHAQSLMLHNNGTTLMQRIRDNGGLSKHLDGFPITVIIGENDEGLNNDNIREFADIIGVEPQVYQTGHSTLLESAEARADLTVWQEDTVKARMLNRHLGHYSSNLDIA